jgi:hypothetical protein
LQSSFVIVLIFSQNFTTGHFGIDVFQAKSGSDEGMCIEITNPTYNAYEFATPSPPFVTDCDMAKGMPFPGVKGGVAEVSHDVTCKFV